MIQDPSKEVTLIVYNSPKPPKYLKINKKLITSFLFIIPVLIISFLTLSFVYSSYLKSRVSSLQSQETKEIVALKTDIQKLETKIKGLENNNKVLTQKVSTGSSKETSSSILDLLTVPFGFKDLRSQALISFNNVNISVKNKNIYFNFDLANNSPNARKLTGYLTIIQHQENLVQYYPSYDLSPKSLRLEFSKGEYFSFSRLRPTEAKFTKYSSNSAKYKVYIFNKTGDLLAYKQFGPFNIE